MGKLTIAAAVVAIALWATTASAQNTLIGTPHDFTGAGVTTAPLGNGSGTGTSGIIGSGTNGVDLGITEYCLPCHAPHHGANTSTNQPGPLWNHSLSVAASFTQGTKTLTLGTSLPANSALCLGCHDGQTAVSSFNVANASQTITTSQQNQPIGAGLAGTPWFTSVFGGTHYVGALAPTSDLTNTHPINVYPNPPYSGFATENTSTGTVGTNNLPLETLSNTNVSHSTSGTYIGCTTCHDPHTNANGKFLRISNTGSALCLNCHTSLP
jgi:predicted CXXCH cytochrome family protein